MAETFKHIQHLYNPALPTSGVARCGAFISAQVLVLLMILPQLPGAAALTQQEYDELIAALNRQEGKVPIGTELPTGVEVKDMSAVEEETQSVLDAARARADAARKELLSMSARRDVNLSDFSSGKPADITEEEFEFLKRAAGADPGLGEKVWYGFRSGAGLVENVADLLVQGALVGTGTETWESARELSNIRNREVEFGASEAIAARPDLQDSGYVMAGNILATITDPAVILVAIFAYRSLQRRPTSIRHSTLCAVTVSLATIGGWLAGEGRTAQAAVFFSFAVLLWYWLAWFVTIGHRLSLNRYRRLRDGYKANGWQSSVSLLMRVTASVMLLWALYPDNPYAYYELLRFVVSGVFAYFAVAAYKKGRENWTWVLGATAVLYNPIAPIHLNRELWIVINLGTIALLWAETRKGFLRPDRKLGTESFNDSVSNRPRR